MIHFRKGKKRLSTALCCGYTAETTTLNRTLVDCPGCRNLIQSQTAKKINRILTSGRKNLEKEMDALWAKRVKEKNGGKCVRCGALAVHAHHIFSRRHRSLRWDVRNGIGLCYHDHFYWVPSTTIEDKKEYIALIERVVGVKTLNLLDYIKKRTCKYSLPELDLMKKQLQV